MYVGLWMNTIDMRETRAGAKEMDNRTRNGKVKLTSMVRGAG
jgi:hypothetical protein